MVELAGHFGILGSHCRRHALRILMKRRAVPPQYALVVNHLYPSAGWDHRLFVRGRVHLVNVAPSVPRAMWPIYRQMVE